MDTFEFKGYEGSVELDRERGICRGKLMSITDLVTYEAATVPELRKQFEAAVDDYIETCRALGRLPQVPHRTQQGELDETPTDMRNAVTGHE
jgi:predicted HicB family RNase H-like nuclease